MAFNRADFYDAELRRHNERFRAAVSVARRDVVLDIGCGAGQTTREAAFAAADGSVLGIDLSPELLAAARRRSAEAGLRNIVFELGDAQVHSLPSAHFDLCMSRFGGMFFADPVAAFANIARAMRRGGRLVLMVWQGNDRNEWATDIQSALASQDVHSASAAAAFSLGDPQATTRILTAAGFASIDFEEVCEPVFYGPNVEDALDAVVELFLVKGRPVGTDAKAGVTLLRLRALLEAHLTEVGVLFGSRAWIVAARKPGPNIRQ